MAPLFKLFTNWTPPHLARGILSIEGRVEQGAIFQHGAGDTEQAVVDRSEGAAMAVTRAAQRARTWPCSPYQAEWRHAPGGT